MSTIEHTETGAAIEVWRRDGRHKVGHRRERGLLRLLRQAREGADRKGRPQYVSVCIGMAPCMNLAEDEACLACERWTVMPGGKTIGAGHA